MATAATTLTAQEEAIESGKKVLHGNVSDRVLRIKEGAAAFMAAERAGRPAAVIVTPEDKKPIDEVLFPYWNGKDFTLHFVPAQPEESRILSFGPDPRNIGVMQTMVVLSTSTMRHSQNWVTGSAGGDYRENARAVELNDRT